MQLKKDVEWSDQSLSDFMLEMQKTCPDVVLWLTRVMFSAAKVFTPADVSDEEWVQGHVRAAMICSVPWGTGHTEWPTADKVKSGRSWPLQGTKPGLVVCTWWG